MPTTVLAVPAAAATGLVAPYGRTTNTAVTVSAQQAAAGSTVDLSAVRASMDYSDGSTATLPIDWNTADVNAVNTAVADTITHSISAAAREA